MRLLSALLVDDLIDHGDGRVDLLGAGRNALLVPALPHRFTSPPVLAVHVQCDGEDTGRTVALTVVAYGAPAGRALGLASMLIVVPDLYFEHNVVWWRLPVEELEVHDFGLLLFHVYLDDRDSPQESLIYPTHVMAEGASLIASGVAGSAA